jgi:hypothetical protein
MNFKEKKPNMNSPHQMEPFDTNFIRFDSLNQCQRHFYIKALKLYNLHDF